MFDSGIIVSDLIEDIKNEADIAIPIPDASYILWLNSVEQLLYSELIREQAEIEIESNEKNSIDLSSLVVPSGTDELRFEDIHAVYADETQLIKSTLAGGRIFPNTYYKARNNIGLNLEKESPSIKIIYFVRPALKTESNASREHVKTPPEFTDLVRSKLLGEAYKTVNEDGLAAKWLNDYNVLLETFKTWLSGKQPEFGI